MKTYSEHFTGMFLNKSQENILEHVIYELILND